MPCFMASRGFLIFTALPSIFTVPPVTRSAPKMARTHSLCDRITVLRDGQLVGEYVIEDLPRVQLVSKMLGKELDDMADIKGESGGAPVSQDGAPVLEAEDLCSSASFWTSCSSREEVGSSRMRTLHSISTARAIATICCTAMEQEPSCCLGLAGARCTSRVLKARR